MALLYDIEDLQDLEMTLNNFWKCSKGDFAEISNHPRRQPDRVTVNLKEEISSSYWWEYEGSETYIIRKSDHWGKSNNCLWTLDGKIVQKSMRIGKINLKNLEFNAWVIQDLAKKISLLPIEAQNIILDQFGKK